MTQAATRTIRIVVDNTAALAGVNQINQAVSRIGTGNATAGVNNLHSALGNLAQTNPGLSRIVQNLQGAGGAASAAGSAASGAASRFAGLGSAAQAVQSHLAGMVGSLGGIATAGLALGATAVVGGLVALGSAAVSSSAKMESYKASLTTVIGDSVKAGQAFDALATFAAKTPFSLDQAVTGFTKLKALGLTPSEAALTSYGNTASSMGKDLNQMIEAVADAATGEFERLKEFGIKSKVQGDQVAFTFAGVTTKVGNNSAEIQKYLMDLGNTKFAGAMDAQAKTFNGVMSNLSDTVDQTFAKVGNSGLLDAVKRLAASFTTGLAAAQPVLIGIGSILGGIVDIVGGLLSGVGSLFNGIQGGGQSSISALEGIGIAFKIIGEGASVMGQVIAGVFGVLGSAIGKIVGWISGAFQGLWSWLGASAFAATGNVSLSFTGILRAVKYVALNIPQLFKTALSTLGGMFGEVGSRIVSFLSGNWNAFNGIGDALLAKANKASAAFKSVGAEANKIANDTKGNDAAWARLVGRGGATKMPDLGATPGGASPSSKKDGGKDKADEEAKKAADRLKKETEYWQVLKDNVALASMLPVEAENFNKQLELRKILGDGEISRARELTTLEKEKIATALQQKAQAEVIRDITIATQNAGIEKLKAEQLAKVAATGTAEQAAINLAVEEKLWPFKQAQLKAGLSLQDAEFQKQLSILEGRERENALLEQKNKLLGDSVLAGTQYAKDALRTNGTITERRGLAQGDYNKTVENLTAARDAGKITAEEFRAGVLKAGKDLKDTFDQIGTEFSDKLGKVAGLFNQIGSMIGGKLGEIVGKVGNSVGAIGDFAKTKDDIASKIGDAFGKDSTAVKGIGKAVGGALAGLQIGESIGGLAKALGIKGAENGSKIGGAIGGLTGNPLIAAAASVVGGIIGALFYKPNRSAATFTTGADGEVTVGNVTGNKAALRQATQGAAGDVLKGLSDVARQLGGKLTGVPQLTIGTWNDRWRVLDQVTTKDLHSKNFGNDVLHDFGDDQGAAVAYAVQKALQQGVITGLDAVVDKALRVLDAPSAIQFAKDWTAAMKDMASMIDPVKAAIDAVVEPLDTLRETMVQVGASTADLTKLDQYRAMKLNEVMKSQLSGLNDFIKSLKGEGSGISKLSQLNADLTEFQTYKDRIASGDRSVDQAAFTKLGQEIFGLARDVYGTSSLQFQDIRSSLILSSESLAANITAAFTAAQGPITSSTDATTAAISAQTDALVSQQVITNDLLRQLLAAQVGANDNVYEPILRTKNGQNI